MLKQQVFLTSDFFQEAYSDDEQKFLHSFLADHPEIARKFDEFCDTNPIQRLAKAEKELHLTTRASWDMVEAPPPRQDVLQHVYGMLNIAEDIRGIYVQNASADVRGGASEANISRDITDIFNNEALFSRLKEMIRFHDIAEAIIGDFPNHEIQAEDSVSWEDKGKIERLAAKLLFETEPDKKALYDEYEHRQTPMAKLVKSIDILEFMHASIVNEPSSDDHKKLFDEFWRTSKKRLNEVFNHEVPRVIQEYKNDLISQSRALSKSP